ncbi:rCG30433 [Rattus norvegicus]|uniref:RCG30433 n=1 Tax=Rattus norvegicus TaxID=10116 RepID=A6JFP8_RAT|nr:rCG30433 [Rattus norvegicus]
MCKSMNSRSCGVCMHTDFLYSEQPLLISHNSMYTDNGHRSPSKPQ